MAEAHETPASAQAASTSSRCSSSSVRPGRTGATSTPVRMPASAKRRRISSRLRPGGVPGSTTRRTSSSSVPTLMETVSAAALVQPPVGVEVAQDHGRLRQDRERVAEVGQRLDHAARQPVAALAVLVGVGGRAHGHRLPVPARRRELAAQHLDDVRLDDDLRGEVVADPQVQVAVERAGEAVVAAMRAPAVRVHSPAEGDPAQLRHPVQSRLAGVLEVLRASHVPAEYRTYVRVVS